MKAIPSCRSSARTAISIGAVVAIVGCVSLLSAGRATAATSLIAAYDKYVSGKGFEIGLVNVGTGADIAVPAGVNTADDELHPALTPDGRLLVFTRMQVRPLLNGDVVPPSSRSLVMVNRTTGGVGTPIAGDIAGAGPTIAGAADRFRLAYGLRPAPPASTPSQFGRRVVVGGTPTPTKPPATGFTPIVGEDMIIGATALQGESASSVLDVPEATLLQRADGRTDAYTHYQFNPGSGGISNLNLVIEARTGSASSVATSTFLPGRQQPTLRSPDGYAAFSSATNGAVVSRISTMLFPGQTVPEAAPDPINAPNNSTIQTMPAWSPDGLKLAFVRNSASAASVRKLLVFDTTPGIQTIMNPAINLGDPTPSFQLKSFHDVWGGISLALETKPDAVAVSCTLQSCLGQLNGAIVGPAIKLTPTASGGGSTAGGAALGKNSIGILVARVVGQRSLFGRKVAKIKPLGRVPLGRAKRGRNRFSWNGRVAGRKLKRGKYVITYRVLTSKKRVQATSRTISFSVTSAGRIVSPRVVK